MPDDDFDDLDLDEDFDDLDEEEEAQNTAKKPTKKGKTKSTGIGASAVAEKLGANPKTFRAWLRRKVDSGDLEIATREPKQRYSWKTWKDPELVRIMKAWKSDSHEKGGGKKGAKKKASDKKEAPAKKKASAKKKAPAKKKARTRKSTTK